MVPRVALVVTLAAVLIATAFSSRGGSVCLGESASTPASTDPYTAEEVLDIMVRVTGLIESGQTMARQDMLERVGLSLLRLREPRDQQRYRVLFETWRLSGDFDIQWMKGFEDKDLDDPRVYGIRILHRETRKVIAKSFSG